MSAADTVEESGSGAPSDIRPVIKTGGDSNWTVWAFAIALVIGGAWLFNALSSAREAASAPSITAPTGPATGRIASPEPLAVPDRFLDRAPVRAEPADTAAEPAAAPNQPRLGPRELPVLSQSPPVPLFPTRPLPPPPVLQPTPQVVFEDNSGSGDIGSGPSQNQSAERVKAGRLSNPSLTIPQGTVIPAVLETAIDSTRPGGARALVQRDMYGFDGTKLLIPRGSRLYGEYEANLRRGQNRALVQWTRLIRPDGVTIALNSPSSDPLGRAGIKGKVDGKFWQRFGGALLNSVLDIGVGLAVNEATDGVIVALPGSTQNVDVVETDQIRPTLKVKHGTSVSVFVARDLDFSSVER